MDAAPSKIIKIFLQLSGQEARQAVSISENATVNDLKLEFTKTKNMEVDMVRLIFSGKYLEEAKSLASQEVRDGVVVHVVEKNLNVDSFGDAPMQTSQLADNIVAVNSNPEEFINLLIRVRIPQYFSP